VGTKFTVKGKIYDISDDRIRVWPTKEGWRGMVVHADGSDGQSTALMGATNRTSARAMLIRMVVDWTQGDDATPEELGLT
jgi:hypothetical protein